MLVSFLTRIIKIDVTFVNIRRQSTDKHLPREPLVGSRTHVVILGVVRPWAGPGASVEPGGGAVYAAPGETSHHPFLVIES